MARRIWGSVLALMAAGMLALTACSGVQVTPEQIQGFLQAMEGKEMVISLDDGSTVRITVEDSKAAAAAEQLVGREVQVEVKVGKDDNVRRLSDMKEAGEDASLTGTLESLGADAAVIGGKTFKVDAATRLDDGLAVGVKARVEFVTQPDGSLLAREIETDEGVNKLNGVIESIGAESWTVGGKTFKVNAATRLDDGLLVGVKARVEFIALSDGSLLATEIETDEAEERFNGTVESVAADTWVVSGRTFKVTDATRIDEGLTVGLKAKVRFMAMTDGSMVATRIHLDKSGTGRQEDHSGAVEAMSETAWTVGGKTFKVIATTRTDPDLEVGDQARVRFTALADGSMLASNIQEDKRGSGKEGGEQEDRSGKGQEAEKEDKSGSGKTAGQGEDRSGNGKGGEAEQEAEDTQFTGAIESMGVDAWIIGGKTFKVDAATRLDSGLAVGVQARVEFVTQSDGSMLAKEIETAK